MTREEADELRLYRAIMAQSSDVTWILDARGLVTYVSPNRLGGRPLPAPIGELSVEHIIESVRPGSRDKLRAAFALALRNPPDKPIFFEVYSPEPDGSERARECVLLNRLDDPDIRGILAQTHDIGDVNEPRRARLDAERHFRALFEATSAAVTIRDVATQTLIDCNDAALRLYGARTLDDMRSLKPNDLAPPMQPDGSSSIEGMRRSVEHAVREGSWTGQWLARRLTGETFTARIRISKIDLLGGAVFQSIIEDVTDLTRAREEALAATGAKSAFLATMSHELRSPLNAVIGMVDLLSGTSLDERQRRYAEVALASARGLMSIIGDILDFSKIEAGKLEVDIEPFELQGVIDAAASVLALSAEERGIVLACSLDPVLRAPLLGDPARLRQVLVNLIGNAVKFTDSGAVHVRALVAGAGPDGPLLRIEVEDTGSGIAPEDVERIFSPFTQAESPETRRRGGTGLGLAICRQIIESMGGTIGVESAPGRGSTFWFQVGLARAPAEPPVFAPVAHAARASDPAARILVVDDSAMNAEVTSEILRASGYGVVVVSSGEEALAEVTRTSFDLVLLDRYLPGIDGHETARRIRALEQAGRSRSPHRLPIVGLTASATADDSDLSREAGMDDRVSKPIERARLLQIVLRHLTASRLRSPVDLARSLARLGGEAAILRRAALAFLELAPGAWSLLKAAIHRRDRVAIEFAAHRLRGQASTFDALELVDALRGIEAMAEGQRWERSGEVVARVEHALEDARQALEAEKARGIRGSSE
jgi:PAS domain S-box-containing protein